VAPDVVLFVNGIPLVVIECKSPHDHRPDGRRHQSANAATPTSAHVGMPEGNEQLFWTNQFVVSTYGDKAELQPLRPIPSTSSSGRMRRRSRGMSLRLTSASPQPS